MRSFTENVRSALRLTAFVVLLLAVVAVPRARATSFTLGVAGNYAVLYEGGGGNTLQITNVTVTGNVGVGGTGQANLGGPGTITGRLDFSAPNGGQLSGNNVVISGGVNYSVAAVTNALNLINALNTDMGSVNGTDVNLNNSMTIDITTGLTDVGHSGIRFFDVTGYSLGNNQTLTIQGDPGLDAVAFNFTSSTNFNGQVALTGGLTADQVLFNFVGGSGLTGGPTLQINNQGDVAHPANQVSGIFLDPNGPISVVSARIAQGRVFGGDTHDFQLVSGSSVTQPPTSTTTTPTTSGATASGIVPEPTMLTLFGSGVVVAARRRRRRSPAS